MILRNLTISDMVYWALGIVILLFGLSYLASPLYRIFCETTSFEGIAQVARNMEKISKMKKMKNRLIKIKFSSVKFLNLYSWRDHVCIKDKSSSIAWNFKPLQEEIYVYPGETALAFYTGQLEYISFFFNNQILQLRIPMTSR